MNGVGPSTRRRLTFLLLLASPGFASPARSTLARGEVHVWELQEVALRAAQPHENPYSEVVCWIDLEGPGFARRVYGFWDGGLHLQGALRRHGRRGSGDGAPARTSRPTPA